MATRSTDRVGVGLVAVVVVLIGAAAGVGGYAYHASHVRQLQLHDDELRRQRDTALNSAQAKGSATRLTTMPAGG